MKTCTCGIDIIDHPASRCLDDLVAEKVLGFIKVPFPGVPKFQKPTVDGVVPLFFTPNYSSYISDAWEVAERMRELDQYICPQIYWDDNDGLEPGYWVAEFNRYAKKTSDYRHYEAVAETAPLAICRAALLMVNE